MLPGEYITIYQYQRQQQRKALQEKEAELDALNRDREDLRGKLFRLEEMVRNFVAKESGGIGGVPTSSVQKEASGAIAANPSGTVNGQSVVTDSHDDRVEDTSNCK